ncbi:MAG TPA: alcohol dehydrogenase, partial [Dehalococcoidia bacterium]|nr:alcohol dehydrogenase [Dehalococcoidia bacterium]
GVSEGGTAILVGVPEGEATINALDMLLGAKSLKASIGGSSSPDHDFPEFVRWYKEGLLDLDALVTKRWKLDDINEAVDELRSGNVFGRSILEF